MQMLVRRPNFKVLKDVVWSKILTLGLVIFFIFLADSMLSFWVPNLIENSLKSPVAMGFIISFSSVIGLGTDILLPQLVKGITVKLLLLLGMASSILFSLILIFAISKPLIPIFLLAMAVWGFYYEFLGFSQQQFVSDSVPIKQRSGAWGILRVFRGLSYFLGPMLANWLLLRGDNYVAIFAIVFVTIGLFILQISGKIHNRPLEINIKNVNLVKEIEHWGVLFKHVWPIVVLSIMLGIIDSFFWTIGAIWTEKLVKVSVWGSMFLPFYMLPTLFMGFVVAKWGIYKGKKKLTFKFFLVSGIILALLGVNENVYWQLIMVLLSGTLIAIVLPLSDGVYTDIIVRMGRERKHMIGLSNSSVSLAYIIGPAFAGIITANVGERMAFAIVGVVTVLISIWLLAVTPKKLKISQQEIRTWKD